MCLKYYLGSSARKTKETNKNVHCSDLLRMLNRIVNFKINKKSILFSNTSLKENLGYITENDSEI